MPDSVTSTRTPGRPAAEGRVIFYSNFNIGHFFSYKKRLVQQYTLWGRHGSEQLRFGPPTVSDSDGPGGSDVPPYTAVFAVFSARAKPLIAIDFHGAGEQVLMAGESGVFKDSLITRGGQNSCLKVMCRPTVLDQQSGRPA